MRIEGSFHARGKNLPGRVREIGRRICALREHYMLSQDEFAKRLLVSRNYLSELENGKRTPQGPLLVALSSLFMADREWILTGKGEMISTGEDGGGRGATVADGAGDVVALLKGYRSLSTENRKKLMNILRVFRVIEEKESHA